ncbi:MAG: RhuM family protein [Patescibacteria group bacterium]
MENDNQVVIYTEDNGSTRLEVTFRDETVWLNLNQIAKLFGRDKSVISRHLSSIFKEKELDRRSTVAKNATVQIEQGREVVRQIEYFNLDAIISVGYRVNSKQATQFRMWATDTLKEHILKGYTVNENRLRDNQALKLKELEKTVSLLQGVIRSKILNDIVGHKLAFERMIYGIEA